jgi:hypothetical protein
MSNTLRVEALFMQAGISILGVEMEACSPPLEMDYQFCTELAWTAKFGTPYLPRAVPHMDAP